MRVERRAGADGSLVGIGVVILATAALSFVALLLAATISALVR